ncbi:MAG: hypothetical protein ACJ8EB_03135 [Allosphingosinicella sp.]
MIDRPPLIERVYALPGENTEQSVTYAALEARLTLEKVCYDCLGQAHDDISHAQLRRRQPTVVAEARIAGVGRASTRFATSPAALARPQGEP